jgi:ribokinase
VFNPAPVDPGFAALWQLADLVVLNRTEARDLTGKDAEDAATHIRAAGAARVAVTLGADGAVLQAADRMHRIPAAPATVRDTTGAGDTFTAILAAALFARRLSPEAALRCAARAAAITVGRRGTLQAFPTTAELAAILAG